MLRQAEFLSREHAVVITNPPYMGSGKMSGRLAGLVKEEFPDEKQDLYACFVSRAYGLTRKKGLIAVIVGDTWMTIKTFEPFRSKLLSRGRILNFLHLDDVSNHPDVFGANAAFVLERDSGRDLICSFVHLEPLSSEQKRLRLKEAIAEPTSPWVYAIRPSAFGMVPGAPFAYRMSDAVRSTFDTGRPLMSEVELREGLTTGDNGKYLRYWWEVSAIRSAMRCNSRDEAGVSGARWFPHKKGGPFRRWYGNQELVINWANDGAEIKASVIAQ